MDCHGLEEEAGRYGFASHMDTRVWTRMDVQRIASSSAEELRTVQANWIGRRVQSRNGLQELTAMDSQDMLDV